MKKDVAAKPEIKVTEEIKIIRLDDRNVQVLRDGGVSEKTGETIWQEKGFYPNVRNALRGILNYDMLVNFDDVEDIKSYKVAFDESVELLRSLWDVEL